MEIQNDKWSTIIKHNGKTFEVWCDFTKSIPLEGDAQHIINSKEIDGPFQEFMSCKNDDFELTAFKMISSVIKYADGKPPEPGLSIFKTLRNKLRYHWKRFLQIQF